MDDVDRRLRIKEVAKRIGVSDRTVWRLVADGALPRPIPVSKRVRWWPESIVMAYIERCKGKGQQ